MKWIFLVHQIQTRDSRERVRVWRMTKKIGAVLYRNSVYVLPHSKERLEDFQWLTQQIRDSKGEASIFVTESGDQREDSTLRDLFLERSRGEYSRLLKSSKALLGQVRERMAPDRPQTFGRRLTAEYRRIGEDFNASHATDFFGHPLAGEVGAILQDLKKAFTQVKPGQKRGIKTAPREKRDFQGKLWSTREHIHIDRLCSAWLIRRFIDPKAKFVFAPESKLPKNSIPFDVLGAEFSHRNDDCTFETLLKVFQIRDGALDSIGQIVHDIDLKDEKFGRDEAPGIDTLVRALSAGFGDDHETFAYGSVALDSLYTFFTSRGKE